jgi:hypothetical protein
MCASPVLATATAAANFFEISPPNDDPYDTVVAVVAAAE